MVIPLPITATLNSHNQFNCVGVFKPVRNVVGKQNTENDEHHDTPRIKRELNRGHKLVLQKKVESGRGHQHKKQVNSSAKNSPRSNCKQRKNKNNC